MPDLTSEPTVSPLARRLRAATEAGRPHRPAPMYGRREFIRRAGLATLGAGIAVATFPHRARASEPRIVIIGAGLAGLQCARDLGHFGIPTTVYEASNRVGGRTLSDANFFLDGQIAEHGGAFISTEHTKVRGLANQLGLDLEVVDGGAFGSGEEFYLIDGDFYPVEEANDDWFVAWKAFKDELHDAPFPQTFDSITPRGAELGSISIPEWFDPSHLLSNPILAQFGPDSQLARLMQTTAISEYGRDAGDQPALNLLHLLAFNPRGSIIPLAGTDELYRVAGGTDQMATIMAAELPGGTVMLEKQLEAIGGTAQGPYTCHFTDNTSAVADHLVLALPFSTLREVDIAPAIWDSFSPQKQAAITDLPMGTNAKLHIQLEQRTWGVPVVIEGDSRTPNGVAYSDPDGFIVAWDETAADPGPRAILLDYTGGAAGTTLGGPGAFGPAVPGDVNAFLTQIEPVFPGTTAQYNGMALKSSWVDNPFSKGSYSSWGLGHNALFAGAEGRREGDIHFAGEHTSLFFQGFMEGAVRSGQAVAKVVRQQV